jgi:hypothetical protein
MFALEPESGRPIRSAGQGEAAAAGAIDPAEVEAPPLRHALALWRDLRGDRLFPSREQMSPRVIGPLLRNTVLIKVLDGGRDFEVRIIGDAILAVQPEPTPGQTTREIDARLPGYGAALRSLYCQVCSEKKPTARRGRYRREADGLTFHREHLLLPLGASDEAVDHLISFIVFTQPDS